MHIIYLPPRLHMDDSSYTTYYVCMHAMSFRSIMQSKAGVN